MAAESQDVPLAFADAPPVSLGGEKNNDEAKKDESPAGDDNHEAGGDGQKSPDGEEKQASMAVENAQRSPPIQAQDVPGLPAVVGSEQRRLGLQQVDEDLMENTQSKDNVS